jgi:SulP family sulfate permease
MFNLDSMGLATVGELPKGLPSLHLPSFNLEMVSQLLLPAFSITVIGMTESIAVAQTLGAAKRQRISANRELLGLGAANIAAGFSGGFPVTGGMARSVVNADAGAETPLAGALTAVFLSLGILFLTPWLAYIPIPVLAATIIVAVSQLLELPSMAKLFKMNRIDGSISWLTAILVLLWEVEAGLLVGVAASILALLVNHRKPYIAELGLIPNTERFKNVNHEQTQTLPDTLFVRIDESLTFLNAGVIEQEFLQRVADNEQLKNLVIVASGIHTIDASGANMLKRFCQEMESANVAMYMTDVKVPLAQKLAAYGVMADKPEHLNQPTIELYKKFQVG